MHIRLKRNLSVNRPTEYSPKKRRFKLPYPLLFIPIATFVGLSIVSAAVFLIINRSPKFRPITSYVVIVSHDNQQQVVPTSEPTVGALLTRLNIILNRGDVVEPSTETPITQDNFRINVYRAAPVKIVDGSNVTYTLSAAATPRSIATQAGIKVYPEDSINFVPVTNFVTQDIIGQQIVINRALPVNVNLYGTPTVVRTRATTVGALLKEKHIVLAKGDTLEPTDPNTPLTANTNIFVIRNGTKIVSQTQSIPAPVQTVQDNSLTFGTTATRQQGSPGTEVLTYQVNVQNGTEVSRTLIQTVVTQQPVTQIIAQGQAVQIPSDKQAVMAEAGISSGDYAYVNYIVSNESGWCPTKVQGEYGGCPGYAPSSIPSYLGYGLGQATPGSKMAEFGGDWETNPVTQLRWATSYADSRYGSWAAAYNHWEADHNW